MDTPTTPKRSHHNPVWPVTIIVASLIIGGSIYASQWSKQKSIEKQQQIYFQANINTNKAQTEQEQININAVNLNVSLNEFLLDKCLSYADALFLLNWNYECEKSGKPNKCELPFSISKGLYETEKNNKDDCYSKFP